jgi:hypothetical protein
VYLFDHFSLSLSVAGILGSLFGFMNLFARSSGGIGSDKMGACPASPQGALLLACRGHPEHATQPSNATKKLQRIRHVGQQQNRKSRCPPPSPLYWSIFAGVVHFHWGDLIVGSLLADLNLIVMVVGMAFACV